jgi:hypothetical protein
MPAAQSDGSAPAPDGSCAPLTMIPATSPIVIDSLASSTSGRVPTANTFSVMSIRVAATTQ